MGVFLVAAVALSAHRLTHLKQLEAESIHIIREVAARVFQPGDAVFHWERFQRPWCG